MRGEAGSPARKPRQTVLPVGSPAAVLKQNYLFSYTDREAGFKTEVGILFNEIY